MSTSTPAEPGHLAWPLELAADGTLKTVAQDSLDDVRQCVNVLLHTPRGARPLAPLIGVNDPTFIGANADQLQADLEEQEPRATIDVQVDPPDENGEQTVTVRVDLAGQEPTP